MNDKLLEGRKLRKGRRGSTFTAPPSPAKSDIITPSSGLKRKGRPTDIDLSGEKSNKRSRSCSRGNSGEVESPLSGLLECPEPSCNKKYRNPNGLRYHQSHAHSAVGSGVDMDDESRDMMDNEDSNLDDLDLGDTNCDVNSSAINNDLNPLEMEEESNSSVKKSDEDLSHDGAASKTESEETDSATVSQVPIKPIKKDIISVAPHIQPTPTVAVATATPFHVASTQQVSPSFGNTLSQSKSVTTGLVTPISATIVTAAPIQASLPLSDQSTKPLIRPKTGTGHPRPIMPSNFIALTTNAAHNNLTPVTTHVPNTTQLKPIQPKPTVMGETPPASAVLLGLKERKQKPKKKPKDSVLSPISSTSTLSSSTTSTSLSPFGSSHKKSIVKLDGGKHEPQGVIKVAPIVAKPLETKLDKNEPEPIRPLGANVGIIQAQVHPMKGIDLSSRSESSPSVLKVTPSLHVPESNKNMSENVQSPAYSDISDANDASSPDPPPASESPQIRMEEQVPINKPKDLSTDGSSAYGMYGQYYSQSNYMLQNLSPSSHSPSSSQKQSGSGMNKDHSADSMQPSSSDAARKIKEEPKDEKREGGESGKMEAVRPFSQSDYHQIQHQKWMQQMYYLQSLPHPQQYQYLHGYGSMMEHGHMMQSDPMYRQNFEKMLEDPRRMAEYMNGADYKLKCDDGGGPRSSSAGPSSSEGHKTMADGREDNSEDRSAREKQNENHLIMRENHDLKTQMDRGRGESASGSDRDRGHSRLTEEQQRRHYMFQQQKHIEHQKREEQRRSEVKSEKVMDSKRDETTKRESESKSKLDSSRGFDDKSRGQSSGDKSRVTDTPKSKLGIVCKDSSPHTPSSSQPTSVAPSPSAGYSPYSLYHNQFMQSPPYGHVQFDTSHPMYQRGINPNMMYPTGGYIHHPSQLGYRMGEDSLEKEPAKPKVPIETEVKVPPDTSHNALYHSGSSHKIHELQEKGRRSPHRASPVLGKTENAVSGPPVTHAGSIEKGREFSKSPPTQRHVHTHHHTHVVEAAYPMYPYTGKINNNKYCIPLVIFLPHLISALLTPR